jgi:mannan endo-1,6-alpha-mannosidase
LKFLLTLL